MKNQKWIVLLFMIAMSTMAFSQSIGVVECNAPEQATVTAVSFNAVAFTWVPGENTTGWIIEVGPRGFIPGYDHQTNIYYHSISKFAPVVTKWLTGLEMDQVYDVFIRSDCDENGKSQWQGPFTFKTRSVGIAHQQ